LLTEQQRRSRARYAALIGWSKTPDKTARTQPMRDGFLARFERQVDPDGIYSPDQRAHMAEAARKAFYVRMGRQSGEARRAKAAKRGGGGDA
jgi:hypothetical protein